eukprot:66637_1
MSWKSDQQAQILAAFDEIKSNKNNLDIVLKYAGIIGQVTYEMNHVPDINFTNRLKLKINSTLSIFVNHFNSNALSKVGNILFCVGNLIVDFEQAIDGETWLQSGIMYAFVSRLQQHHGDIEGKRDILRCIANLSSMESFKTIFKDLRLVDLLVNYTMKTVIKNKEQTNKLLVYLFRIILFANGSNEESIKMIVKKTAAIKLLLYEFECAVNSKGVQCGSYIFYPDAWDRACSITLLCENDNIKQMLIDKYNIINYLIKALLYKHKTNKENKKLYDAVCKAIYLIYKDNDNRKHFNKVTEFDSKKQFDAFWNKLKSISTGKLSFECEAATMFSSKIARIKSNNNATLSTLPAFDIDVKYIENPYIIIIGIPTYKNWSNLDPVTTDMVKMKNLWSNVYKYKNVHCISDEVNGNFTKDIVNKYLNRHRPKIEQKGDIDSLIVILSGHGNEKCFGLYDGKITRDKKGNEKTEGCITYKELQNKFSSKECDVLKGKPKMYYIDCCRGNNEIHYVEELPESKENEFMKGSANNRKIYVNEVTDYYLHFATSDSYYSFVKDNKYGSYFIGAIDECFRQYNKYVIDLNIIGIKINSVVNERHNGKQTPEIHNRLTYSVCFG